MLDLCKKHWVRLLAAAFLIYLFFLWDLGTGTFAQHMMRIVTTPEVKQLGSELTDSVVGVARSIVERTRQVLN